MIVKHSKKVIVQKIYKSILKYEIYCSLSRQIRVEKQNKKHLFYAFLTDRAILLFRVLGSQFFLFKPGNK